MRIDLCKDDGTGRSIAEQAVGDVLQIKKK
jgi:hypothetical protein